MDFINDLEVILKDLKLAKLVQNLMCHVREGHESDDQTVKRIIKEYCEFKYQGIPIPNALKKEESDDRA